jgi:hypothetical protein
MASLNSWAITSKTSSWLASGGQDFTPQQFAVG